MNIEFFDSVDNYHPKKLPGAPSFQELIVKFSQETALYSDPLVIRELWTSSDLVIRKPSDAICILLIEPYLKPGFSSYYYFEKLERHIWSIASNNQFQGKWKIVGELLQIDFFRFGINRRFEVLFQYVTSDSFFGNYLPKMYRMMYKDRLKTKLSTCNYEDPDRWLLKKEHIIYPKRCEYNDKGSRRLQHEFHGIKGKPENPLREEVGPSIKRLLNSKVKQPSARYWYGSFPKENERSDRVVITVEGKVKFYTRKEVEDGKFRSNNSRRKKRKRKSKSSTS